MSTWSACACVAFVLFGSTTATAEQPTPWPEVTQTAKPWTRWWWPGSAVEPGQLSAQLEAMARAGIGGVEITPIYGARGAEARYIDYLSPRWIEMLEHVTREARRLGLGVDMATGTGWPFGGPAVESGDAASSLVLVDGRLTGKPTDMKVKRAAPGGEGLVLDPYSPAAMDRYLARFSQALSKLPRGALRSQFHDSFEYFNASWSPRLPQVFRELNGYDIQQYAAELAGEKPMDSDTLGRIKGDYRRTLAKMHLDYLQRWYAWAHSLGFQARNQAHGAPGGLLDLYGASDIPETESFGASLIPSLRLDATRLSVDPDPPIGLIARFASSAAHVMGRPLVSSETLTWLRENFQESPAAAKPQLDRLFAAGINHIFYHGTTYSPADAAWPGWFFYASTQLNPTNPLWQDFGAMHAYVTRVQSVLQSGRPDNDVLVYWPEADFSDDPRGLMRQQGMHDNAWLVDSAAGRLALSLIEMGFCLDFISDAQLAQVRFEAGAIRTPGGGRYPELVIPKTRRLPFATVQELARLQEAGASMVFEALPEDVAGFGELAERRKAFTSWVNERRTRAQHARDFTAFAFAMAGARHEVLASRGLWVTRRVSDTGHDYFVANYSGKALDDWVPLGAPFAEVWIMDPLDGSWGRGAVRPSVSGRPEVYLQLLPGQSLLLRTRRRAAGFEGPAWSYFTPAGPPVYVPRVQGMEFLQGDAPLPRPLAEGRFGSWADSGVAALAKFTGTVRYKLQVHVDQPADDWWLDLGDVRETARVSLDGQPLGTFWSRPFRVRLGPLKPGFHVLHVDVTSSAANRVRDLDQRKVDWKIMKDTNLVTLRYRPFDASTWDPQPSGLIGPVALLPMRRLGAGELTTPTAPSRGSGPSR